MAGLAGVGTARLIAVAVANPLCPPKEVLLIANWYDVSGSTVIVTEVLLALWPPRYNCAREIAPLMRSAPADRRCVTRSLVLQRAILAPLPVVGFVHVRSTVPG